MNASIGALIEAWESEPALDNDDDRNTCSNQFVLWW